MKARYIRVSSSTQNNARQLAKQHLDETLFIDVVSGAVAFKDRPEGKQLIEGIEAGTIDYISVASIDRLGRNAFDCQSTIQYLNEKKVTLKVDNLGIESFVNGKPNNIFKMITDVLANVAEMERESIRERQKEGIKIAVAQGKFKGRAKGTVTPDTDVLAKYKEVAKELKLGVNSLRKIAKICNVSLSTVQKVAAVLDRMTEPT